MNKYFSLFIAGALLFSSCNNGSNSQIVKGTTAQQTTKDNSVQFVLKLLPGTKYYCSSNTETTINLEVENKKVKNVNNANIVLIYEILSSAPDSMLIKVTYDKIHIELISNDEKQILDAGNRGEEQSPMDKLLGDIKGESLTIILNNKGKVIKATGSKEIVDKVLAGLSLYDDEETKKIIKEQIGKLVGDNFIENTVAGGFNFYPDTTILIGKSWSKKTSAHGEIQVDANTSYTLSSIEDGIASIDIESSLKSTGINKPINMMGQQVEADLSQKVTGSFEANMATGMLTSGKSKTIIEGTISVLNKVVPIEINSKKEVSIKKI